VFFSGFFIGITVLPNGFFVLLQMLLILLPPGVDVDFVQSS
jgi:hypothetical protein